MGRILTLYIHSILIILDSINHKDVDDDVLSNDSMGVGACVWVMSVYACVCVCVCVSE